MSSQHENTLLIIDGLNLVRRIHAAQVDDAPISQTSQLTLNACQKLLKYHQPSHVIVVWDGDNTSWRLQLYPDYKKGRKPMPEALQTGLTQIKQTLKDHGFNSYDANDEADDVIATLAIKNINNQGKSIIVSTDKGFSQLPQINLTIWDYFNQQAFDISAYEQKLGVKHRQFLDYLALAGDSGNKIPGIAGIGPKSAADLLNKYPSLANIYQLIEHLGEKQAQKLLAGKDMARLSYKLAQLKTDLVLNVNLKQYRVIEGMLEHQ